MRNAPPGDNQLQYSDIKQAPVGVVGEAFARATSFAELFYKQRLRLLVQIILFNQANIFIMSTERTWHVVYTKPKCEKKVADVFSQKKIEAYCPMNRILRQWADRKKIIYQPLFSSYVFVRTINSEHIKIMETNGVLNFVHWLGKPAVVRNDEIDTTTNRKRRIFF